MGGRFVKSSVSLAGCQPFEAACWWLDQGARLLPCQPGTKRLVRGYGPNLRRIVDPGQARFWFAARRCNLALVTGQAGGLVCLDFDDMGSFARWRAGPGRDVCAQTRLETSRRGAHVFFCLEGGADRLRSGRVCDFELKGAGGAVVVSPSIVAGVEYRPLNLLPPLAVTVDDLRGFLPGFSLLSEKPLDKPALSRQGGRPVGLRNQTVDDLITKIKAAYDILALAQELQARYKLPKLVRTGQTFGGRCPFHRDRNPSYFVDPVGGFYQCRSCGASGDAINLYALLRGLDVVEAIREMARGLS